MSFFSFLGDAASMFDLHRRHRARMLGICRYTEDVMRAPSALTVGDRELIAAYVSGLNQCRYCHGAHVAFAESHGVDPDMLKAMVDDLGSAGIDQKLVPLLAYCRKLTETPSRLEPADAAAVTAAGWDEEALETAIHVTALFNFYNRLMDGHGIQPRSAELNRARSGFIKQYGYDFSTYPPDMQP